MRALLFLGVWLVAATAGAVPRMSLTAGSPCATCHVSPSGGGLRNEIGWSSMSHSGALTFDQIGLDFLHDQKSNALFDGKVLLGFDMRLQYVRFGRPTLDDDGDAVAPEARFIPMQIQPSIAVIPVEGVTLTGTWSAGPNTRDGEWCDTIYPGQSCYEAQAIVEPAAGLAIRGGVFQPSIGIRHDDHTIYVRSDAYERSRPLVPPNYAEPGVEVNWQPRSWFRADAGGFHTRKLDEILNETAETADLWPAAYLARVSFLPQLQFRSAPEATTEVDEFGDPIATSGEARTWLQLNTWIGASVYGSGDYMMQNVFLGVGRAGGGALLLEGSHSTRTADHETFAGMAQLSYDFFDWLVVSARAERAFGKVDIGAGRDEAAVSQYVATLELFPIPYVEIRPEYRVIKTDEYLLGQTTVQLHVFY
jgi:hypothetical protein